MIWERVPKENTKKPSFGSSYKDWKEPISLEGFNKCVYCAIHEDNFGGIRNYHVEHYRPKSKDEFKDLINEMTNLYYACSICNCFKGDDWPEEPSENLENCAYPDPSRTQYKEIFEIDENTGIIQGVNTAAKYVLNKLNLNRPQLILERKTYFLQKELDILIDSVYEKKSELYRIASLGNVHALKLLEAADLINKELIGLLNLNGTIRPYVTADTKREKN